MPMQNRMSTEDEENLDNLKNMIAMNVPGMSAMPGAPQMGHHHTHNNTTEQGDTESSEEAANIKKMQLQQ